MLTKLFVRQQIADFCSKSGRPASSDIAPGQPFTFNLLEELRRIGFRCDDSLIPSLENGVSTGVLSPLAPSGRWPASSSAPCLGPSLDWCEGNWQNASFDEDAVLVLIEQDIAEGLVEELFGTFEEAQAQWPSGVAKRET